MKTPVPFDTGSQGITPDILQTAKSSSSQSVAPGCAFHQFSLEEVFEDDVGYDADIEVIRPEYEDAESENEATTQEDDYNSADLDEHLVHKLRGLYCDPNLASNHGPQSPHNGRKRMSKEMEEITADSFIGACDRDLEIWELSVPTEDGHRAKRRRNRLARSQTGERIVRVNSQDRAEDEMRSGTDSSVLASSPVLIENPASPETQDHEMTDVIG